MLQLFKPLERYRAMLTKVLQVRQWVGRLEGTFHSEAIHQCHGCSSDAGLVSKALCSDGGKL